MSIHAINWARRVCRTIGVPPQHRHVLLALACFHNDKTGQCNPSYSTLATEVGYSVRKIISMMNDLGSNGLVSSEKRFIGGKQTSNQYVLFGCPASGKWSVGVHHTTPLSYANGVTPSGVQTGSHNRVLSHKEKDPIQEKAIRVGGCDE